MADANTPPPDELHRLLRELAAEDAPAVIERARSRARVTAERLIEERLVAEMLAIAAEAAPEPGSGVPGSTTGDRAPRKAHREPAKANAEPAHTDPPEAGEATSDSAPETEAGSAWWTYCVMWDEEAVDIASGLDGVAAGNSVEAICDGELAALVSRVPLSEYGDEELRRHLENLEWVERTARRHENVLEAVLEQTTIVPLRLCTLYRDTDGVRRLLREHRAAFRDGLSRVEGCVEWGVQVFADTRSALTDPAEEPADVENRGASYLRRRQNERVLAERASEVRARCVDVVHERIAGLARASKVNPPQRPEIHGREQTMLLNSAHLIGRDRAESLDHAVAGLREEWAPLGFMIEITGPWPPYNFVSGTDGVLS